jgi:dephospho-CoA kinase
MTTDAFCFIGFPGAGKTSAMEIAQDVLETPLAISTGDIVRQKAAEFHDVSLGELTGEEIGEFSTFKRENDSPLYVARSVKEQLEQDYRFPLAPVVIEGVRDSEAASFYRSFIDNFHIIFIHSPFEERMNRLSDRGREEDEAGYGPDDLMHREQRELDWGMDNLPEEADAVLMNTETEYELQTKLNSLLYDML